MRRWLFALVVLGCVAGCAARDRSAPSPAPARRRPAAEPVTPTPPPPAVEPTVATAFTLHEWGLVGVVLAERTPRVTLYGGGQVVRAPPGATLLDPGLTIEKPVIYVGLEGGSEARFEVTVGAPGGRILEHWPPGELSRDRAGERVRFRVVARRAGCADAVVPGLDSPECAAVRDRYCELPELPAYAAADRACVQVGDRSAPVLFYRSDIPRAALPIAVRKLPNDDLEISAPPGSRMVGVIARVTREPGRAQTRARIVPGPMPGQSVTLPRPLPGGDDGAAAARWVVQQLGVIGLSDSEIAAFGRAWDTELFGDPELREGDPERHAPAAPSTQPGLRRAHDALLYFLPAGTLAEVAPLSVTPYAREVRRAMMVRVNVD